MEIAGEMRYSAWRPSMLNGGKLVEVQEVSKVFPTPQEQFARWRMSPSISVPASSSRSWAL
jgi:hypothetical protein